MTTATTNMLTVISFSIGTANQICRVRRTLYSFRKSNANTSAVQ